MLLFKRAGTSTTCTATAYVGLKIALLRMCARSLIMRSLSAVALYMSGASLAKRSTVGTLRHWATFLGDVLKRPFRVGAIADTMTSNTSVTRKLLAVD